MLAVAGGKGGCGKTTTTLGLALAAARRGRSVLAVDADVDVPDLHRVAGVEGAIDRASGAHARRRTVGPGRPDRGHERHNRPYDRRGRPNDGIDRPNDRHDREQDRFEPRPVPGTPDVHVLPARPGTEPGSLRDRIRGPDRTYDLVLVDCPAGGGRDAAVPLRAADRAVLVTTTGRASLRDAAKTGAMARAVGTPVAGAVLTRVEGVPDGVGDLLGTTTLEAVPPASSPLRDRHASSRYRRVLRRLPTV